VVFGSYPDALQLTGAAIVRFANTFLDAFKTKDFVLIAIFIWDDSKATRYALFQQQNDQTVWTTSGTGKLSRRRFTTKKRHFH